MGKRVTTRPLNGATAVNSSRMSGLAEMLYWTGPARALIHGVEVDGNAFEQSATRWTRSAKSPHQPASQGFHATTTLQHFVSGYPATYLVHRETLKASLHLLARQA
jgi:hypothetical protein